MHARGSSILCQGYCAPFTAPLLDVFMPVCSQVLLLFVGRLAVRIEELCARFVEVLLLIDLTEVNFKVDMAFRAL